jgi:crotonobetainyl-CoA:carnitine CoA-transferase CaiB-like acyl-CoA transferase
VTSDAPLTGIRVVEITNIYSGPMAGMLLAEMGAEVIKVESPDGPDLVRAMSMGAGPDAVNPTFYALNRGKRFVSINAKSERGRQLLIDLVAHADVFLHNIRPGKPEGLGVGYEELAAANPRLIYAAISGMGIDGPEADAAIYDYVVQARVGMVDYQRDIDSGRSDLVHQVVVDKTTAMATVQAILAALLVRERTGKGQRIDLPMLGAGMAFMWPDGMAFMHSQLKPPLPLESLPPFLTAMPAAGLMVLPTTDGEICLSPLLPPWDGLCLALDRVDWVTDERFAEPISRAFNIPALKAELAGEVAKYSTAELLEKLRAFDVASGPVVPRTEIHLDEQVRHTGILTEQHCEGVGMVRQPRPMWHFDVTPALVTTTIGRTGEHTAEVLAEFLELNPDQIEELHAAKIVTYPGEI